MSAARILVLVLLSPAAPAYADGPYEGEWRAGPMRIDVAVESWGADCGPRPQSTTVPGGATVRVTQTGDDLTFHGRPVRTTRGCWSENSAVQRVSATYQAGTWRIVCRTPEDDPRAETGTYTLRAIAADRLEFRDVSRYDWQLNESVCRATMTSTQTFERVVQPAAQPEAPPQPPSSATTPAEPTRAEPACTPGAPARIQLRPADAVIAPGMRQCFQARLVDASGCAIPGRTPQLELRSPPGASGALRGNCFQAGVRAAEAEGEFMVVAREGPFEARARLTVRTPDLSDLIARRAEGGGAVSTDGPEVASAEEAARVAARSEARRGSLLVPVVGAIVGVLLVGGASIGLMAHGRRRRRRSDETVAGPSPPHAAPAVASMAGGRPEQGGEQKICPTCRRGHPPDATHCAADGTALITYAEFVARSTSHRGASRVCPVCGARFAASTRFCGKDGAELVDG